MANPMRFNQNFRKKIRRSRLYPYWQNYRQRQQLAAFHNLLDSHAQGGRNNTAHYSLNHTKAELLSKRSERREFRGTDGQPHIIAFGVEGWERYGLWSSFRRMSHFELFSYGLVEQRFGGKPSPMLQRQLHHEFLAYVDKSDKESPVTACFFYADSAYISPKLIEDLAQRGIWTILMGLDDKHRFYERKAYDLSVGQITLAKHADLMWTTWKVGTQIILNAGGTPWYAPPGADPAFHYPIDCDRDLDVVFVGQNYGIRSDLVNYLMQRGFHIHTYGSGWPNGFVSFEESVRLFSRAKVVLGVGGVQSMAGVKHLKGRDFEVPMCGAVYLTSFNYELADFYDIGRDILCYGSFEECAEILHSVLQDLNGLDKIRTSVLQTAVSRHTWDERLKMMGRLFSE